MSALHTFEGSYGGHALRIADDTRLECKICWWVYDPAIGCESRQVPPGTPFTRLPHDWRCPSCDALPSGFMALDVTPAATPAPVAAPAASAPPPPAPDQGHRGARALGETFEAAFRELHRGRMRDVPFLNKALQVQAIGFRPYEDEAFGRGTIGVLLTPWFMNLVVVQEESPVPAPPVGGKSILAFPSGRYEFIWNDREETGPYRACSLFSPVTEFASQLQAVEIGIEVLRALFQEEHREEGTRSAEIRALRAEEIRRQEAPEATPEAHGLPAGRPGTPAAGDPAPTRRTLLVPRRREAEPAPAPPQEAPAP